MKTKVRLVLLAETYAGQIYRIHCDVSMTIFSVFVTLLTATYVREQYKGKTFLHFHCNNRYTKASLCYFIPTLPNLIFPLRRFKVSNPLYTPGIRKQIDEGY
jgi:hypothetical protein